MHKHIRPISIHPPRAGRDTNSAYKVYGRDISIHPPRAGRDTAEVVVVDYKTDFNPPAPCGAGLYCTRNRTTATQFQSTRPVRGGTTRATATLPSWGYFNPPAPCGAGPPPKPGAVARNNISIHPPRAGRDPGAAYSALFGLFQSTRPVRGGTIFVLFCNET